jgi:hypothetical protein
MEKRRDYLIVTAFFVASVVMLGGWSNMAREADEIPHSELAHETAELPFDAHHLPLYTILFGVGLSLGMLALMEIGRRIGVRHLTPDLTEARKGLAAVDGAIFSLLGLLVAFTFHGAAERFDTRREQVIQEADHISTAWQRLDLLAEEDRAALRELFREYLEARLAMYRKLPNDAAAKPEIARSGKLRSEIWRRALAAACNDPTRSQTCTLVVPALNQMFNMAQVRAVTARIHPPQAIFAILIALTLISALLIGYGMAGRKSRSWTHILGFVITMAAAICLIYELEYPRLGWIRIDPMDQVLVELRRTMD